MSEPAMPEPAEEMPDDYLPELDEEMDSLNDFWANDLWSEDEMWLPEDSGDVAESGIMDDTAVSGTGDLMDSGAVMDSGDVMQSGDYVDSGAAMEEDFAEPADGMSDNDLLALFNQMGADMGEETYEDELMLEDAIFAPEDDAVIAPISLAHSEAGCEFVTQEVDGEQKEVAVCELTEALPKTQLAEAAYQSGDPTEKIVVCNALTGQCDFVLVEDGHVQIPDTELEYVPI